MPKLNQDNPEQRAGGPAGKGKPVRVLVAESDAIRRSRLRNGIESGGYEVVEAVSLEQVRQRLREGAVRVALVDAGGAESAAAVLRELSRYPKPPVLLALVDETMPAARAIEVVRAGATDLVTVQTDWWKGEEAAGRSATGQELVRRIAEAVRRHRAKARRRAKVRRLRADCRRLTEAREQIARQVDVICHDLVAAYQDLVLQVQQITQGREFAGAIAGELGTESLVRRSIEFLLECTGACNIVVALPTDDGGFRVAGYVAYEGQDEPAEMLLQHLLYELSPRVVDQAGVVHARGSEEITKAGGSMEFFSHHELLLIPCAHGGKCEAVAVLFRDAADPFDSTAVRRCGLMASPLAQQLAKAQRVTNRWSRTWMERESGEE